MWRKIMRITLACIWAVCFFSVSAFTLWAQQSTPTAAAKPSQEDVLKAVRADMQSTRANVMAKNLPLTAEQAAKFWPLFEQYQKEQNVIMDEQLKGIQKYVDSSDNLDDAGALALITAHLERDAKMNALRQKW